jgi:hypothetical protein
MTAIKSYSSNAACVLDGGPDAAFPRAFAWAQYPWLDVKKPKIAKQSHLEIHKSL